MEYKKYKSFDEIDKCAFARLALSSFKEKLVSDYFEITLPKYIYLVPNILQEDICYIRSKYIGAMVVLPFKSDAVYLDKLMLNLEINSKFTNNLIKKNLWKILNESEKKIIWRARTGNYFNKFYEEQCTGLHKIGDWIVYSKGLSSQELNEGVDLAINKIITLRELHPLERHFDFKCNAYKYINLENTIN